MRSLTEREEEIMRLFWERGPLFVREIIELWPEPKPHVNTVSTFVRILEEKGFVGHEAFGKNYRYHAEVSESDFRKITLKGVLKKYFSNSVEKMVSTLVEEEDMSVDELMQLIDKINNNHK